jgi:hypothetical protein
MCRAHLDPEEALTAFELLGARQMMPIHFDTFVNSFDAYGEAPRALDGAMARRGVGKDRVVRLAHGQRHVFAWRDEAGGRHRAPGLAQVEAPDAGSEQHSPAAGNRSGATRATPSSPR